MFNIGDVVRILEPFNEAFHDEYTVVFVDTQDTYVLLENVESAFDWRFVEVVRGNNNP